MDSDARYHPLVEGTSAAIFVFDAEQILYINPAARTLTGRPARDLLGSSFLRLIHPQFRARYESPAALAAGSQEEIQIVRRPGGARWINLRLQPILYRGAAATLGTAFDIHDLKESDLARRDANERAGQSAGTGEFRPMNYPFMVYRKTC